MGSVKGPLVILAISSLALHLQMTEYHEKARSSWRLFYNSLGLEEL